MRHLTIAATCLLLAATCHAHTRTYSSSTYSSYSTQGAALRTTKAGVPQWAQTPHAYALGTYSNTLPAPHGVSTARSTHVQALRTCNPFAGVSATHALAGC